MRDIKFTFSRTGAGRKHYLTDDDVRVLLSRLSEELWERLRVVHFNDRSKGCRWLGYVNGDRRELAICALPERVSLTKFLVHTRSTVVTSRRSTTEFGAVRGCQWSEIAVRRFMLYEVFLHELGHSQIVEPKAREVRRRFAGERRAQEFADYWREQLWSSWFDHPDSFHNRATRDELEQLNRYTCPVG